MMRRAEIEAQRRKAYEEYVDKQRKFYEKDFEQYVKVLERKKKESIAREKLPKEERYKLNKGMGSIPNYDPDEAKRQFDRQTNLFESPAIPSQESQEDLLNAKRQ